MSERLQPSAQSARSDIPTATGKLKWSVVSMPAPSFPLPIPLP
jgi:hypothetical protein